MNRKILKQTILVIVLLSLNIHCFCWGFYAHRKINYYAVFLLPPQMIAFYKQNIVFITDHSTDPDKRRYLIASEGAHHYIDIDRYGNYPFDSLPHKWKDAVKTYSEDTLKKYGIVPWWIQTIENRLVNAFREKNKTKILKLSADLGHYIADAHVPLHNNSNHNGQLTEQQGIHAFWESRIPELLAEKEWSFFMPKAEYIDNPEAFIWKRILESAAAADTVLRFEKQLSGQFPVSGQFAFENRNGKLIKQYATGYTIAYNNRLNGMVERRMRQSIFAIASFWYTAWINAGQPDLTQLSDRKYTPAEEKEFDDLEQAWRKKEIRGREEPDNR